MPKQKICSIEGCGKPTRRREWCGIHYDRWRRNGDPLAGRTAPGEPERFLREVVLKYDGDDCLIWPYARSKTGYAHIRRDRVTYIVSRIICEETNGPPPTPEHHAAHNCGRGHEGCIAKSHLTWKTLIENNEDKYKHGRISRGENRYSSKLTERDVIQIRSENGITSQLVLARRFNVSQSLISRVINRHHWAWLSDIPH